MVTYRRYWRDRFKGYLKITDRKKDIIVNLGGDNISPSKVENYFVIMKKLNNV